MKAIEVISLSKIYEDREGSFKALSDVNLTIETGDIYGIIGMSGAGKSTLVRCLNYLEKPTSGRVIIEGTDLSTLKEKDLQLLRRKVSMIFQQFNLLNQKNVLENVCFPLRLKGVKKNEAKERALELLSLVGLEDKAFSYPSKLSGGQKQRVAIARALASDPSILLCDEATSALDPQTTGQILDLLKVIHDKMGITIVLITHEMSVVRTVCNKVALIDQGILLKKGDVKEVLDHVG